MPQTVESIGNVVNPSIGTTAISDLSGTVVTVQGIIRYNGKGRFTCAVSWAGGNGTMDVYFDTIWKAKIYKPERYRDEEGVEKGL